MLARIVPFTPAAYPEFTALWNQAYPELKRTEFEMRLYDQSRAPHTATNRWLAEQDGRVVGFCGYEPVEGGADNGQRHQLHLFVTPAYQRKGIGTRLYDEVSRAFGDASQVRAWARQDRSESVQFLTVHGFVEEMRTFHSALDTATFDFSRLEKFRRRLEKYDYRFRSF